MHTEVKTVAAMIVKLFDDYKTTTLSSSIASTLVRVTHVQHHVDNVKAIWFECL